MKKQFYKIMCYLGLHTWSCKAQDCIDEFGFIPMDGRMPKTSKCAHCSTSYSE